MNSFDTTHATVERAWLRTLKLTVADPARSFFDEGGSSLAALQLGEDIAEELELSDAAIDAIITAVVEARTFTEIVELVQEAQPGHA